MSENFTWPDTLAVLLRREDLTVAHASWAMNDIITGKVTNAQLAGFLMALAAKGESVDEIVGFREAILENSLELRASSVALDIVGTGGDRHKTVNISSMASIVAAAAGVPVIKHGNRAASSASGSSDVLSELGINLDADPEKVARVFDAVGITFVFAAAFHPGFRHAGEVRRELGVPTVFNILGPLCNPARPIATAMGVSSLERVPLVVGVLQSRDATALVFRGDEGLDELSTTGHSHMWEISHGQVVEHDINPEELGIPLASLDDLRGGSPGENAAVVRSVLDGTLGPVRDIVLLNAAAGLAAFDLAQNPSSLQTPIAERLRRQMEIAAAAIDSGAAQVKLAEWAAATV